MQLEAAVEPWKLFRLSRDHRPFQGVVRDGRFSIRRIIHYENSFRPQIKGVIEAQHMGTRIRARLYPHLVILAFVAVWCTALVAIATRGIATNAQSFPWLVFVPVGMVLFAYGLMMGGFWWEAGKARRLLASVVGAA